MSGPFYVRSVGGNNANSGLTWALAKATLAGAYAAAAAGDTIWVRSDHNETTAGTVTNTAPGTITSPNRILCTADAAEPPTSITTGAKISNTTSTAINNAGSFYMYGIAFDVGTGGATSGSLNLASAGAAKQYYDTCDLQVTGSGGSSWIVLGPTSSQLPSQVILKDCRYKFGNALNGFSPDTDFEINGGSIISGSTTVTNLFNNGATNRPIKGVVTGLDLTNMAATTNMVIGAVSLNGTGLLVFRGCKLPAAWSGSLVSTAITGAGLRVAMYDCDNANTNYKLWIEDVGGSIRQETTVIETSPNGASDGTTGLSWKMASNATNAYPATFQQSDEMVVWNDVTGSPRTLTIDILRDSLTNLKDNEVWVRVFYPSSASAPVYAMIESVTASVVATPADLPASTSTWTTTGITNPNKQKLVVTFTPQQKGPILASIIQAKPSNTIYGNPVPVLTS